MPEALEKGGVRGEDAKLSQKGVPGTRRFLLNLKKEMSLIPWPLVGDNAAKDGVPGAKEAYTLMRPAGGCTGDAWEKEKVSKKKSVRRS